MHLFIFLLKRERERARVSSLGCLIDRLILFKSDHRHSYLEVFSKSQAFETVILLLGHLHFEGRELYHSHHSMPCLSLPKSLPRWEVNELRNVSLTISFQKSELLPADIAFLFDILYEEYPARTRVIVFPFFKEKNREDTGERKFFCLCFCTCILIIIILSFSLPPSLITGPLANVMSRVTTLTSATVLFKTGEKIEQEEKKSILGVWQSIIRFSIRKERADASTDLSIQPAN